jgi:hypothetical protein
MTEHTNTAAVTAVIEARAAQHAADCEICQAVAATSACLTCKIVYASPEDLASHLVEIHGCDVFAGAVSMPPQAQPYLADGSPNPYPAHSLNEVHTAQPYDPVRLAASRKDAISTLTEVRLWPAETHCCSRCLAPAMLVDGAWRHADPADDAIRRVTGLIENQLPRSQRR